MWNGTSFSCATNEIILRHNSFMEGTEKDCNDGAIIGESLRLEEDCYTSQLHVNVSSDLNNRTIGCFVNIDSGVVSIGNTSLTIISGNYLIQATFAQLVIRYFEFAFPPPLPPNSTTVSYPKFFCRLYFT